MGARPIRAGTVQSAPVRSTPARSTQARSTQARSARGPSWGAPGHQPDPYTRAVLQSYVGRDLGDVRVHSGPEHDARLDHLGVDGLTEGRQVTLRRRHDDAGTLGNRVLLLHELTHVLQQAGVPPDGDGIPATAAAQEEQAHRTAVRLAVRPPLPSSSADDAAGC